MSLLSSHDLHRIFQNLDRNGDGLVSLEELSWLLERTGLELSLDKPKLESLVEKSSLDFDEFIIFYDSISQQNHNKKQEEIGDDDDNDDDIMKAFKVFDMNGDGFISSEELECVLLRLDLWDEQSELDCATMICAFDGDSDGRVNFEEFKNMMLLNISS